MFDFTRNDRNMSLNEVVDSLEKTNCEVCFPASIILKVLGTSKVGLRPRRVRMAPLVVGGMGGR